MLKIKQKMAETMSITRIAYLTLMILLAELIVGLTLGSGIFTCMISFWFTLQPCVSMDVRGIISRVWPGRP